MKSTITITILAIACLFISCADSLDETLLHGKWKGADWLVEGKPSGLNAASIQFEFKADGTYEANFVNQKENGTYYLAADKLYTTDEGKAQKVVRLLMLTQDSIKMDMNRGGTTELLILKKE